MDSHSPTDHDRFAPPATAGSGPLSPTGSTNEPTRLRVRSWPQLPGHHDEDALASASDATLLYWTPILGPTGALLLHRLALLASTDPDATTTVEDLAQMLRVGPHKVAAAIRRLERHDLVTWTDTALAVRLWLPALTDRHLRQLPSLLAARYRAEMAPPNARPAPRQDPTSL